MYELESSGWAHGPGIQRLPYSAGGLRWLEREPASTENCSRKVSITLAAEDEEVGNVSRNNTISKSLKQWELEIHTMCVEGIILSKWAGL